MKVESGSVKQVVTKTASATASKEEFTSICKTSSGEVYMADGTDEQVRAAWQVLAAHRETSYARFDTTRIYVVQASGSSVSTLLFLPISNPSNSQSALGFANFGTSDASPVIVESDAQSITYKDYTSDKQVQVTNSANGVVATTTSISNPSVTINQRAVGVGSAQCI